jgi:hypothetical protein
MHGSSLGSNPVHLVLTDDISKEAACLLSAQQIQNKNENFGCPLLWWHCSPD